MNESQQQALAAIRERHAKATPGPYRQSDGRNEYAVVVDASCPSEHQVRYGGRPVAECDFYGEVESAKNVDFLANSWSDIAALLDIIDGLTRQQAEDAEAATAEHRKFAKVMLDMAKVTARFEELTAELAAAAAKRDAEIVAWLRERATLIHAADAIERGECGKGGG
jgi:hypothetical protein